MILLDVVDGVEETASTSKPRSSDDSRFSTRRRPDSIIIVETESVRRLDLPDYATSQALAGRPPVKQEDPPRTIWKRPRFWRTVVLALVAYVILSVCIAVPLALVCATRCFQELQSHYLMFVMCRNLTNRPHEKPTATGGSLSLPTHFRSTSSPYRQPLEM